MEGNVVSFFRHYPNICLEGPSKTTLGSNVRSEGRYHLEDQDVYVRIILKFMLGKEGGSPWTGHCDEPWGSARGGDCLDQPRHYQLLTRGFMELILSRNISIRLISVKRKRRPTSCVSYRGDKGQKKIITTASGELFPFRAARWKITSNLKPTLYTMVLRVGTAVNRPRSTGSVSRSEISHPDWDVSWSSSVSWEQFQQLPPSCLLLIIIMPHLDHRNISSAVDTAS